MPTTPLMMGGFNPLNVVDPGFVSRSGQGVTLLEDDTVNQWADISGNGRHVGDSGFRPGYTVDPVTGRPVIEFTGDHQALNWTPAWSAPTATLVTVFKLTDASDWRCLLEVGSRIYVAAGAIFFWTTGAQAPGIVTNQTAVVVFQWTPTSSRISVDGGAWVEGAALDAPGNFISIGYSDFSWYGYQMEYAAYPRILSDDERNYLVRGYAQEWQVTLV